MPRKLSEALGVRREFLELNCFGTSKRVVNRIYNVSIHTTVEFTHFVHPAVILGYVVPFEAEVAWLSGWSAGLVIRRSRVQVPP